MAVMKVQNYYKKSSKNMIITGCTNNSLNGHHYYHILNVVYDLIIYTYYSEENKRKINA